jgi:hypothetical protein
MGPIFFGIALILIGWLVALPYPLGTVLVVLGILLLLWGVWILFPRGPYGPDAPRRRVRWY